MNILYELYREVYEPVCVWWAKRPRWSDTLYPNAVADERRYGRGKALAERFAIEREERRNVGKWLHHGPPLTTKEGDK